jgi:hypothetical protein
MLPELSPTNHNASQCPDENEFDDPALKSVQQKPFLGSREPGNQKTKYVRGNNSTECCGKAGAAQKQREYFVN